MLKIWIIIDLRPRTDLFIFARNAVMLVLAKREVTNKAGLSLIEQGHQQRLDPWRMEKKKARNNEKQGINSQVITSRI